MTTKNSVMEENTATQLSEILSGQLLPAVMALGKFPLVLAQQPLQPTAGITARKFEAPLLPTEAASSSRFFLSQWKRESMHAVRYPYFCCALEGEADMRLAFPTGRGQPRAQSGVYQIVTLRPPSLLAIPPGVLYPDGMQAHWEREDGPVADSRLFWMLFLPTGVLCHTCSTRETKHICRPDIFAPDLQTSTLAETLIEELQASATDANLVAQSLLLAILLRVQRGLVQSAASKTPARKQKVQSADRKSAATKSVALQDFSDASATPPFNSVIVERACTYIRAHLSQPFGIRDVAEYSYVSPSHLTRLFHQNLGTTVMKYVSQQRLEHVRHMLANTELAVQDIAHQVGYQHTPQLNRVFKQVHGVTPTEFRNAQRTS
jgi:AraC-like DNA-binding protein